MARSLSIEKQQKGSWNQFSKENSLFLMSEEYWGRFGFRYSRTQEPKRYYGVNLSIS